MAGFWLASYVALWVVVGLVLVLQVGVLREFGISRRGRQIDGVRPRRTPPPGDDGPPQSALLPDLEITSANGYGLARFRGSMDGRPTLVMFMSALCEGCQLAATTLDSLLASPDCPVRAIIVMRGDEAACRAFLSVFPIRAPVIFDPDSDIYTSFEVHNAPFGLLYDAGGALGARGTVMERGDIAALVGQRDVTPSGDRATEGNGHAPSKEQIGDGASPSSIRLEAHNGPHHRDLE